MPVDPHTLLQHVNATITTLEKLPAKAKNEFATDTQLSQFNELRNEVIAAVPQTQLMPPPFRLAVHSGAVVGGARYADVVTAFARLKVILESVDLPPAPSMG